MLSEFYSVTHVKHLKGLIFKKASFLMMEISNGICHSAPHFHFPLSFYLHVYINPFGKLTKAQVCGSS